MIKKILMLLMLLLVSGCEKKIFPIIEGKIKPEEHYIITNDNYLNKNKKINIIVSVSCTHCYDTIKEIKKMNLTNEINFIPVGWIENHIFNAKILYTVLNFSSDNEIIFKLFELIINNEKLNEDDIINFLSKELNKNKKDVIEYLNSKELEEKIQKNIEYAEKNEVNSVPVLYVKNKKIIMDNIKTNNDLNIIIKELIGEN